MLPIIKIICLIFDVIWFYWFCRFVSPYRIKYAENKQKNLFFWRDMNKLLVTFYCKYLHQNSLNNKIVNFHKTFLFINRDHKLQAIRRSNVEEDNTHSGEHLLLIFFFFLHFRNNQIKFMLYGSCKLLIAVYKWVRTIFPKK